jgi:hypothetical protein
MCQFQFPSHLPVDGRPLKLHGQPKSQLQASITCPRIFQWGTVVPGAAEGEGGVMLSPEMGKPAAARA